MAHDISGPAARTGPSLERQRLLENVLDAQLEIVCRFRADGTILFANRACAQSLDTAPDAIEGRSLWDFVASEDRPAIEASFAQLSRAAPQIAIETRAETADGPRWTLWRNHALTFDDDDRWATAQATGIDITDRERAEETLRRSEARFHQLADAMPQLVMVVNDDGEVTYYNARAADYQLDRLPGCARPGLPLHPDDRDARSSAWRSAVGRGGPFENQSRVRMADGSYRWHLSRAVRAQDSDGNGRWLATVTDIHDLKAAQEALQESMRSERERSDELQAVLRSVPASVVIASDPECRTIVGNPEFYRLTRLPEGLNVSATGEGDEPATRRHYRELRNGEPFPPEEQPMQVAARTGKDVTGSEVTFVFDDGVVRHIMGNASPLRDANGAVRGAVGAFIDITARKEAEDKRKLLLDELNHRVKNTLTIVQAIAQQTFKNDADKARGKQFENRIMALATAHDTLTRSKWNDAPLSEVLDKAFAFCEPDRRRIVRSGPALTLSADQVVPITLTIHELCTNAIKYGALSRPSGRVDLLWNVVGAPHTLEMIWREHGGQPVQAPSHRGFGTRLIASTISRQLGGQVDLLYEPGGFECRMRIPTQGAAREN